MPLLFKCRMALKRRVTSTLHSSLAAMTPGHQHWQLRMRSWTGPRLPGTPIMPSGGAILPSRGQHTDSLAGDPSLVRPVMTEHLCTSIGAA